MRGWSGGGSSGPVPVLQFGTSVAELLLLLLLLLSSGGGKLPSAQRARLSKVHMVSEPFTRYTALADARYW